MPNTTLLLVPVLVNGAVAVILDTYTLDKMSGLPDIPLPPSGALATTLVIVPLGCTEEAMIATVSLKLALCKYSAPPLICRILPLISEAVAPELTLSIPLAV